MSEEIKEKLDLFPNNMNDIAKEAYYQLENYITNLQQKVEQLEKENKRLNNIINELEEYIKFEIPEEEFVNSEWYVNILDKLKELKESNNDKK